VRRAQELAADRPDGLLDPRLLLALDEAGNIAALRSLPTLATTGRGQGIAVLSIFHDLGQLQARYGPLAQTVVNGHRAKLFLAGQADVGSLELAAKLVGSGEVAETSVSLPTWPPLTDGSRTVAQRPRPLLPPDRLRRLRRRQGLLIYGHLPPVTVRLRAWWRCPSLRRRAQGGWSR
jgi:type IV secretory pathway TraG/TraD family ATPase VirD4